jgi:predicted Zn-dependent protease
MRSVVAGVLAAAAVLAGGAGVRARAAPASVDEAIAAAYHAGYSLDEDQAEASARLAVSLAPDDPRTHRALASMLWLQILVRRGAMTIDAYLGGLVKGLLSLPKPPPDLETQFKQEVARVIDLATARLKRNGKDLDARYELGAAYVLQASYAASVEGNTSAAFFAARKAYDAHEQVLDADPARMGASVTLGTYRYLVSGLALPQRLFAYIAGFGGGKERGIAMVEAATHGSNAEVEAKSTLVLIYSTEGRHADAARVLHELVSAFPRNHVFALEEAAATIRAGRPAEADVLLTRGMDALAHDARPKLPGERAIWLYKRGVARLAMNRTAEARVDLSSALTADPPPWVRGRIDLYLGRAADVAGDRTAAVGAYRQSLDVSRAANDPVCTDEAARGLRQPYKRS